MDITPSTDHARSSRPITLWMLRALVLVGLATAAFMHYDASSLTADPALRRGAAAMAAALLLAAIALPPRAFAECLRGLCFWPGPFGPLLTALAAIAAYFLPWALAVIWRGALPF
jgi:hypothetical protein